MIKYALIVVILVSQQVVSAAGGSEKVSPPSKPKLGKGEYAVFVDGQYRTFKFKVHDKIKVSANCFPVGKSNCKAILAVKNKQSFPNITSNGMVNIAGSYCKSHDARNLIATDAKRGEIDVCYFKDNSLIDSWDLFHRHFPAKPSVTK